MFQVLNGFRNRSLRSINYFGCACDARRICDEGNYIASYDDLVDGEQNPIDVSQVAVSMNGIELQDREFFAAIDAGREPNSSVGRVLECYRVLHQIEQQLEAPR